MSYEPIIVPMSNQLIHEKLICLFVCLWCETKHAVIYKAHLLLLLFLSFISLLVWTTLILYYDVKIVDT